MSKFTNRPMSEYESATFWAVVALVRVLTTRSDTTDLLHRLKEQEEALATDGCTNGAAIVGFLIDAIECERSARSDDCAHD